MRRSPGQRAVAGAALAVGILLAGCSVPAPSARQPSAGPKPPATSQAGSAPAAAGGSMHGIVLAIETGQNTIELEALDPATGAITATRTFAGGSATLAVDPSDPGYVWRQAFNQDLTELAATGPQAADGSTSAGYVSDQGGYTALTASTSGGYGTPLQKTAIGFNPRTGYLWYQTPQGNGAPYGHFGYVNPVSRVDTLLRHSRGFQNGAVGGLNDRVYFGANGYGPIDIADDPYAVYLTSGIEVAIDQVNNGYQIGRDGKVHQSTRDTRFTPRGLTVPWMKLPVDASQFLATNQSNQLYLGTLGQHVVRLRALLPASSRTVGDAVVNPAHTMIAFVSSAGAQSQLYVLSLTAPGSQPQLLGSFNGDLGAGYGLIDWLP